MEVVLGAIFYTLLLPCQSGVDRRHFYYFLSICQCFLPHTDPHFTRLDGQTLPSLALLHIGSALSHLAGGHCPAWHSSIIAPALPESEGAHTLHRECVLNTLFWWPAGICFWGPTGLKLSGREFLERYHPQGITCNRLNHKSSCHWPLP